MSLTGGGGQSWLVGKLSLSAESAGVQPVPSLGPPWHTFTPVQEPAPAPGQSASLLHGPLKFVPASQVWLHTGQTWMPGAFGNRSPSRKSSELSGRLRLEAPVVVLTAPGSGLAAAQLSRAVLVVAAPVVVVSVPVVVVAAPVVVVAAPVVVVAAPVVVVAAPVVVVAAPVVVVAAPVVVVAAP